MSKSDLGIIQSRLNAPKGQFNQFGNYKYRSCEDILEALKPLLDETESTLTISDDIVEIGDRIYVKATACWKSKDGKIECVTAFAREEETKKGMDVAQITGSASSYARKYALNGLFLIDDSKDPDTQDNREQGSQPKKQTVAVSLKEAKSELWDAINLKAKKKGEDADTILERDQSSPEWNSSDASYLSSLAKQILAGEGLE